jgi:hypothetical protein
MIGYVSLTVGVLVSPLNRFNQFRLQENGFERISFWSYNLYEGRSQWQRGLRHVLSSAARTLGSQFRILLGEWMCVAFFLCCVDLCR